MSGLADRAYRAWMLRNGAELTERERWLRDALLLRRPGQGNRQRSDAPRVGLRGPERSVGRGRSAPGQRGAN